MTAAMNCIVIYDITSTRIRNKIAELCMDYGLNRIQYSAFAGRLLRTHQEELIRRAADKLGKHAGRIYLYCIGEREWGQRLEHMVADKSATDDAPSSPDCDKRQPCLSSPT